MFQRDYILRMIEQLARVLAKLLLHVEKRDFRAVEEEIDHAYKNLVGLDRNTIHSLSGDSLIDLLNIGFDFKAGKSLVIAKLLMQEANLMKLKGYSQEEIEPIFTKSLQLLLEALLNEPFLLKDYSGDVNSMLTANEVFEISPSLKYKLFQYMELSGQYALAENLLFELAVAGYRDIKLEGNRFYQRLSQKSAEELEKGNFSREEIEQGRSDFSKFS